MIRPARRSLFATLLVTGAVCGVLSAGSGLPRAPRLANAAEPVDPPARATVPDDVRDALARMARYRWSERLKPLRPDPAPEGWEERLRAEWAVNALAAENVPALLELVASDDRFTREFAVHALGLTGDPAHAPLLLERLAKDDTSFVRCRVIEALTRTGGEGVLDAFEELAASRSDPDAAFLLGIGRSHLKGVALGRPRIDVTSILADHQEALRIEIEPLERGQRAPELGLSSPDGPVNLSLLEGKVVVLVFTHGERSLECTKILQRFNGARAELERLDVEVVVVDPHEKERTARWAERTRLQFRFASDPAGRAQARYGVARQLFDDAEWLPSPAWFVIDARGKVQWWRIGKKRGDHAWLGLLLPVLRDVAVGVVPDMPNDR